MAYTLQALIATAVDLAPATSGRFDIVGLPQGMALLPITARLRRAQAIPFLPLTDEGQDELPESIVEMVISLKLNNVAYVEAEFFGGDGTQAAVVWEAGSISFGPIVSEWAIDQALKRIGVSRGQFRDEFDALELGRFRCTEKWTYENTA